MLKELTVREGRDYQEGNVRDHQGLAPQLATTLVNHRIVWAGYADPLLILRLDDGRRIVASSTDRLLLEDWTDPIDLAARAGPDA